ncbi:L,D-transpeptidase family protein [Novosphingobium album (ex Liu et al. 2023)]|uniref:L,D-transpeptidase family protein n=1 Tax=Novosphingobium album (ex Liu et al. 2023) TaxID=3031130 RepID=A0ABT5WN02_9SPHN|nr:L,D-transpeptidase family protein [Novosphingobium album (ex Liu et al. 2023)]MDE8651423.1 L,D-transpeptidase family protein [Novosphingobium album (ex Liu et al. 2023)]
MRRLALASLLLLPALGGASGQAPAPLAFPLLDYIRVEKAARRMTVYADGRPVHTISGIQLGDAPVGPKRFEGDERTPEGRYTIDWGNPGSAYHLSLHISYPEARDRAYAAALGRSPGGMIMIHGQPNALPAGRVPGDWTDGCIAVANDEIEALWDAVPDGTVIDILP